MLLVKTYLAPSSISGTGVFAGQIISRGDVIWQFDPKKDVRISPMVLEKLTQAEQKKFKEYAYYSPQSHNWVLSLDNDSFTNHSQTPNTTSDCQQIVNGECVTVAIRDIMVGEEITADYSLMENKHA